MGTKYYFDELMKVKSQMSKDVMKAIGDSHASWEEFDDMDEATQKLIVKQTEHILTELAENVKKKILTCTNEGLIQLVRIIFASIISSQSVHLLTKRAG